MLSPAWKYSAVATLTMFVFIVQNFHPSKATQSTRKYASRLGSKLSVVTGYVNAGSKIECVLACRRATGCVTVSLNEKLQQCGLSNLDTCLKWTEARDWRFKSHQNWDSYSQIVYPVAQFQGPRGKYTLGLSKARKLCLDVGTKLASTSQVWVAHAMGLDLCTCAWFTNGRNGVVLQVPNPKCFSGKKTGILFCDYFVADAWCVMQ